jgi:PII-like signaling protein
VNDDCLKLTTYFGERDRAAGGWLADAFVDIYARHGLQASLVMRGMEGFGVKQRLRTDRLLSLSEDLPFVSVAVDTRARIEAALEEVSALEFDGLLSLERARMLTGTIEPVALEGEVKLTVYVGRHEGVHRAVVALLREHGVAGATVLLGVDGTAHGVRHRAAFFGRNAGVPLMVIAVGDSARIGAALPELGAVLEQPLITLERIRACKRDGVRLAAPQAAPDGTWQKLMVYAGEQSGVHSGLVRRLRRAGAAGATTLRGVWGYHGDHAPHGDSLWQLRRRVPVVTVVVDTPARTRRWFAIVDELTRDAGLVTSEIVPVARLTHERNLLTAARLESPENEPGGTE